LLLEFTAATVALPESKKPPITAFAPRSLNKRAKRVAELAVETKDSDPEARHALRVALKRLRYALEFFAPLFPARRMQRYQQSATGLLDLLGRMNDTTVAEQLAVQALPGHHSDLVRAWLAGRNDLMLANSIRCWPGFSAIRRPGSTAERRTSASGHTVGRVGPQGVTRHSSGRVSDAHSGYGGGLQCLGRAPLTRPTQPWSRQGCPPFAKSSCSR
jgi:hypothetical protein